MDQPEGRPMRRDAARNHRLVLDAALDVISEHGTDASMELIASRAGVGVGTVYRRFPNKEALIDALVVTLMEQLIDAARQELTQDDGTGLETFLRILGNRFSRHRGYIDKLVSHTRAECAEHLRDLMGELLAQAQRHGRIRPEITLGDVQATIWGVRGVVESAGAVAPDAWERHLDIHLAGLRAPEPPSTRPPVSRADLARISGAPRGA
ncbi:helix-turn-helix domain-containing protein [Streptacidiphilus sp. N1-10]|uniref:Helix-turn-helix domain-containing protein n=1 Tax=Streptacidiphilus jeojiensis TaxID=3229225 RepID=A0ABV6XR83_9ACTN